MGFPFVSGRDHSRQPWSEMQFGNPVMGRTVICITEIGLRPFPRGWGRFFGANEGSPAWWQLTAG